jgi:hypothetical protein
MKSVQPESDVASDRNGVYTKDDDARKAFLKEVDESIAGVIETLKADQAKKTVGDDVLAGEWGSQMIYRKATSLMTFLTQADVQEREIGQKIDPRHDLMADGELPGNKGYYDSNCYETSTTAILLADTYLNHHDGDKARWDGVVKMLDLAMGKLRTCKVASGGYAFWPYIQVPKQWASDVPKNTRIRGPAHFPYRNLLAQLQNNNPADVDDTGLSMLAFMKYDQIKRDRNEQNDFADTLQENLGASYAKYLHLENGHEAKFVGRSSKGAFLVWWGEKSPNLLAMYDTNPVMPMNFNVMDCVGNANALGALSLKKDTSFHGYMETCISVTSMVFEKKTKSCGLYYPSPYNLHYSIGAAIESGATCLNATRPTLITSLEREHNEAADGSWNPFEKDESDRVQTTLFALSAYLKLVDPNKLTLGIQSNHVYRAVRYLLDHRKGSIAKNRDGAYIDPIRWEPGIHFSAGPAFASQDGLSGVIVWKSRGFANAMMLEILYSIKKLYPQAELVSAAN